MRTTLLAAVAACLFGSATLAGPEAIVFRLDADANPVVGSDGLFEPGELAGIAVMETRSGWGAEYPEAWRNGEWEFAAFKPDDHTLVERDYQPCFACHKPLHDADYVFSFDALAQAAGN
jgi:Cytochrome P460